MIEQLASKHQALVLLQETHCHNAQKLVLPGFALAGATLSRKHAIATFVQDKLSWSLFGQSLNDSDIKWLSVEICGFKIINVYKPPPSQMTPTSIPMISHPCLYAGDFNCQHTSWGYTNTNEDGSCLATWAAGGNFSYFSIPRDQQVFSLDVGDRRPTLTLYLQAPVTTTNFLADVSLRSSPDLNIGRHS